MAVAQKLNRPPAPGSEGPRRSGSFGGTAVIAVPTSAVFVMVAAVVVVNEVNQWWTLLFAMFLALLSTALVVATIMRMLAESD